jgi:hypothetical protein
MGGELSTSVLYVDGVTDNNGDAVDTSGTTFNPNGTMEANDYTVMDILEDYLGGSWVPPHYEGDVPEQTEYTTTWYFGTSNGAASYALQGSSNGTTTISGITDSSEEQLLGVDATNGKFNNASRTDEWAQVNTNTVFTIPVVNGSVITFGSYGSETLTIDGTVITSSDKYTYTGEAGTVTATVSNGGYLSYITVVSPAGSTDTEEEKLNYSIALNDSSYYESSTQGAALLDSTIAELAENGITLDTNTKFHDSTHGTMNLQTIDIAAPGTLKITLGDCKYGASSVQLLAADGTVLDSADLKTGCYSSSSTEGNGLVVLYYSGTDAADIQVKFSNGTYVPYLKVESIDASELPEPVSEATITYSLGNVTAEGSVPVAEKYEIGTDVTVPLNRTLYVDGKTLTAWTDGTNTYAPGSTFKAENDVTLTPVFTENTKKLAGTSVTFDFRRQNGAPTLSWEGVQAVYVAQAVVDGVEIDVKMDVDTTSGKIANASWSDWAQMNNGTVLTVPVVDGSVITPGAAYSNGGSYTINGTDVSDSQSVTISDEDASTSSIVIKGGSYFTSFTVTYPVQTTFKASLVENYNDETLSDGENGASIWKSTVSVPSSFSYNTINANVVLNDGTEGSGSTALPAITGGDVDVYVVVERAHEFIRNVSVSIN